MIGRTLFLIQNVVLHRDMELARWDTGWTGPKSNVVRQARISRQLSVCKIFGLMVMSHKHACKDKELNSGSIKNVVHQKVWEHVLMDIHTLRVIEVAITALTKIYMQLNVSKSVRTNHFSDVVFQLSTDFSDSTRVT